MLESEERLRLALDAGKIGVWDWDIKNDKLTWTDNVYKIHGVDKDTFKVTVKNLEKLIYPSDRKKFKNAIIKTLHNGFPFALEFRILANDNAVRWVATQAILLYDNSNKPMRMLGATSDITQQKQIEQDKSDFLSMASHELKTPLTSMKMFVELLSTKLTRAEYDKSLYFASRIKDQTDRLTDLTNDLLDVSRIETGKLKLKKETMDLNDLAKDVVEGLQATTDIKLVLNLCEKTLVHIDRYRIYQVLVNLLTNAIKYSPNNKKIIISLNHKNNEVITSVKDYGIGISREMHDKIFDRLYQVTDPEEKTYPGLGLGLYISKEIIQRHHGKIWLKSKKGKGSTFYFSLPLSLPK